MSMPGGRFDVFLAYSGAQTRRRAVARIFCQQLESCVKGRFRGAGFCWHPRIFFGDRDIDVSLGEGWFEIVGEILGDVQILVLMFTGVTVGDLKAVGSSAGHYLEFEAFGELMKKSPEGDREILSIDLRDVADGELEHGNVREIDPDRLRAEVDRICGRIFHWFSGRFGVDGVPLDGCR
jgi:hypothetical protein